MPSPARKLVSKAGKLASKAVKGVSMEASILRTLHQEVHEALARAYAADPGLKRLLEESHAYAVFPSVGKASAVLGGAYGKGEVFEHKSLVGYSAIAQLTLGVQLGGQTFTQIIVFEDEGTLDRFKQGRFAFAASASAVLVKAGAAASAKYVAGTKHFVLSEGGMSLEAAIGTQKFFFFPAVMGRGQNADQTPRERPPSKGGAKRSKDAAPKGRSKGSPAKKSAKR
jgi:lipid-binding SYLF domain-containing protein